MPLHTKAALPSQLGFSRNWHPASIKLGAAVSSLVLAACASLPDSTVTYYLTRTDLSLQVNRNVYCNSSDAEGTLVVDTEVVQPLPRHFADQIDSEAKHTFSFSDLNGLFHDGDVKFEFTDDRRLVAVQSTSVAVSQAVIKTVIESAKASGNGKSPKCKDYLVRNSAREWAAVLLEFTKVVEPDKNTLEHRLDLKHSDIGQRKTVLCAIGEVVVKFNMPDKIVPPVTDNGLAASGPTLAGAKGNGQAHPLTIFAREPARATLTFEAKEVADRTHCLNSAPSKSVGFSKFETKVKGVPIAHLGVKYPIAVPKPDLFGEGGLQVTFFDSGALKSLHYKKKSGASDAAGVLGAAQTATAGSTDRQKADELKAQADLIYQQERLRKCRKDSESCN